MQGNLVETEKDEDNGLTFFEAEEATPFAEVEIITAIEGWIPFEC
ncbi:hypothetical protein AGMMS49949_07680 [Alphaproteobacteria bacterium]|nr:hypothetical protein AGMMS49949_07670 [Alphaproteobacteria bacterium]GHS94059.1 hypothetical protein AGMMS49949_07680 [Alphaproteobacteria bacterium]